MRNLMPMIQKVTTLRESLWDFPASEDEEYKQEMRQIGDVVGSIVGMVTGFSG